MDGHRVAEYKVSLNSAPVELAGGRPLGPGETVKLTAEQEKDPHNKALIDSEVLLKMGGGGK